MYAIANKSVPYTEKTLFGVSLESINRFLETLHKAYHQEEVSNKQLESFLFLINTECIFHPSLLNKIFSTCKTYFKRLSDKALPGFSFTLAQLQDLTSCPLNTIAMELWDYFSKIYFNEDFSMIKSMPAVLSLKPQIEIAQEMSNYFAYSLLAMSDCLNNEDNMIKLKNTILNYLSASESQDITWSLLTAQNYSDMELPSVFNNYFDFYILYHFYASNATLNWSQKDLEYSYIWNGYNPYVKYLLEHKK